MAKASPSHAYDPVLVRLGLVIKNTRKRQQLSQEEMALISGLDRSYVGGIERGEHNITVITLEKLANGLKVSSSYLLDKSKD